MDSKTESKTHKDEKVPVLLSCRWIMSFTGMLGFAFIYAFRINMSMAIVCMVNDTEAERNVTDEEDCGELESSDDDTMGQYDWDSNIRGHILSSFFYGYMVTQIPGGMLADRFGGKHVMSVGMLLTTFATILLPVAADVHVGFVIFLRVIVGLGTGVTFPAMNSMWGRWAPPLERSQLTSFCYAGTTVGNILTLSLSGVMCASGPGWPLIFYVFGGLGFLWCLAWMYLVYNSPEDHPRISKVERDYILATRVAISKKKEDVAIPWFSIATSLPVWAIMAAHVCNNWGNYTLLTNLPTYMKEVLKFDIRANGLLSSLPYIVQFFAAIGGGQAVDFVRRRGWLSTTNARKAFQCSGFLGNTIFMIATGFVGCNAREMAIVFLCLAVGFTYGSRAGYNVNHVDIAPRYAGLLFGITNTAATLPGILAPIAISEMTPNGARSEWQNVFFTCAGFYALGGIAYALFASGEVQDWAKVEDSTSKEVSLDEAVVGGAYVNEVMTTIDEKNPDVFQNGSVEKYGYEPDIAENTDL